MKDREYMNLALALARKAGEKGDVPVGAVIVRRDKIIGQGYNKREEKKNALLHAEICAINEACEALSSWRLTDAVMYVTLEPCPMCAGAIINSRIGRVVFGAYDEKGGCSMIVAPDGKILEDLGKEIGIISAEINPHQKYMRPAGFGRGEIRCDEFINIGLRPEVFQK